MPSLIYTTKETPLRRIENEKSEEETGDELNVTFGTHDLEELNANGFFLKASAIGHNSICFTSFIFLDS